MSTGQRSGATQDSGNNARNGNQVGANEGEQGATGMTDVVHDAQETLKDTARETFETAKQAAQDISAQTQEQVEGVVTQTVNQASQAIDDVKAQASSTYTAQRDRAIETLDALADALKTTGQQLARGTGGNSQNGDAALAIAPFFNDAADRISSSASFLRDKDMNGLIQEAQTLARKQPLLFLGAMLGVGVAAARLFKGMTGEDDASPGAGSTGAAVESKDSIAAMGSSHGQETAGGRYGQSFETPASEDETDRPDVFLGLDEPFAETTGTSTPRSTESGS